MRFLFFITIWFSVFYTGIIQAQGLSAPASGKYNSPLTIVLNGAQPGQSVFFTTNGEWPDTNAVPYTGPFTTDTTLVLRAMIWENGVPKGNILQRTYLLHTNHTFPVVSLIFNPADFFDPLTGIYTNFTQNWEAPAWFEFFENNPDTLAAAQPVRIEIQGGASAVQAQKSLQIKPLSGEWIEWPVFSDRPFNRYKRLVLRNSGQDWMVTQFRDAFVSSLVDDTGSFDGMLQNPDLDLQAARPSVVYLNGRYWGIYNIRERMNDHYVKQHYDLDDDELDVVENYANAITGDSLSWFSLFTWMQNNFCAVDSNYQKLLKQIDYQNFLDYSVLNTIIDNQDWPGNNNRRWRERSADGKWRWLCYDLDFSFGLGQPATGGWNNGDPTPNALARLLDSSSIIAPNPDWSTLVFRRFWERESFRNDFANRTADWLNTIFRYDQVQERLNAFENRYQPEITGHYIRWWFGAYDEVWRQNIDKLRYFSSLRPDFMRDHLRNFFPEKNGDATLTFSTEPSGAGNIQVSTIQLNETNMPWSGKYFAQIPIPVRAVPNPGWIFKGWNVPEYISGDTLLSIPDEGTYQIVAIFEKEDISDTVEATGEPWVVFPNPAINDWVNLKGSGNLSSYSADYSIVNMVGEQVKTGELTFDSQSSGKIDVQELVPGIYFLKIGSITFKIVKM